jgi:uncharacterized protein
VSFADVAAVEERLIDLMHRNVPLVERLERAPGQKENRYRCLLTTPAAEPVANPPVADDRLAALEARVVAIEEALGL